MSMLFRFRFKVAGAHTYVRVFAGKEGGTLGKAGNLVFRNEEWADLAPLLEGAPHSSFVEIVPEE
jgi:hypothetical protein